MLRWKGGTVARVLIRVLAGIRARIASWQEAAQKAGGRYIFEVVAGIASFAVGGVWLAASHDLSPNMLYFLLLLMTIGGLVLTLPMSADLTEIPKSSDKSNDDTEALEWIRDDMKRRLEYQNTQIAGAETKGIFFLAIVTVFATVAGATWHSPTPTGILACVIGLPLAGAVFCICVSLWVQAPTSEFTNCITYDAHSTKLKVAGGIVQTMMEEYARNRSTLIRKTLYASVAYMAFGIALALAVWLWRGGSLSHPRDFSPGTCGIPANKCPSCRCDAGSRVTCSPIADSTSGGPVVGVPYRRERHGSTER